MSEVIWFIFELLIVYVLAFLIFSFNKRKKGYDEDKDIGKRFNHLYGFDMLTEYAFIQSLMRSKSLKIMASIFIICVALFLVVMLTNSSS